MRKLVEATFVSLDGVIEAPVDLPCRMVLGYVDGEPLIVRLRPVDSVWTPESVIRLEVDNSQVIRIGDYLWCPWLLPAAGSVVIESNKE